MKEMRQIYVAEVLKVTRNQSTETRCLLPEVAKDYGDIWFPVFDHERLTLALNSS
jgi:hypothetical protein